MKRLAIIAACVLAIGCSGIEMRECWMVIAIKQPETCAVRGDIRWGWDSTPRPGDGAAKPRGSSSAPDNNVKVD